MATNKRVKLKTTPEREYQPIKVTLEFTIETKQELFDFREEFKGGEMKGFNTSFSGLIYDIFRELKTI